MSRYKAKEELRQIYQQEEKCYQEYIPAKPKANLYGNDQTFRVCAYCRVSTDNDEQLSSFELQQSHYRQLAMDHPNWELKHIYADEGISGTSLKNRDQFNEMIAACKQGKYDLIVTKSVSRFARNLVDCISLIRMLKGQNPPIGVFFETDNLYTLAENTEFMLSFLATFAQEESVKKSEAMNWSLQQRFKDGKLLTPALLGYDRQRDVTGRYIKYAPLVVNQAEAKIVTLIFDAYLAGWTMEDIAAFLTDIGAETKLGGTEWSANSINYILTNERYCGDIWTWKTFTADLYEHKHRKNRRDRTQYRYRGKHEAIVSEEKFEDVQALIENRKHHIRGGLPVMQVIDEGIFRGFIPINHHWVNDDPGTYYDISNSIHQTNSRADKIEKASISAFNLEGYQVVRGQFLQIRYEGPTLNISRERIAFNKFCMQKFADVAYIQLLLHPAERKLAIRPCQKTDAHSIRWRPDPEKPIYSKTLNCQHFGIALYSIMKWNPDYVYKIRGTWAARLGEQIIVFNLPNAVPAMMQESENGGESKVKKWIPLYPEEWEDDFGEEFYEHALDNGFYYITPNTQWHSQSKGILAPGIKQYTTTSPEQLQVTIDDLVGGTKIRNEEERN